MTKLYSQLHGLYGLSKTLRFELKPEGKTKENFQKYLLAEEQRNEKFKIVKTYCDCYHKHFIEKYLEENKFKKFLESKKKLQEFNSNLEKIQEAISLKNKDKIKKTQDETRKIISNCFENAEEYKGLFEKEMFEKYIPYHYEKDEKSGVSEDIKVFAKFTTYFSGYNENRKNMYLSDDKSTAIAFRLINQNLPIYIHNIENFKKIVEILPDITTKLKSPSSNLDDYFSDIENYTKVFLQSGIDSYNEIIGGKSLENGKKIQGINEFVNLYNQKCKDKKDRLPKLKPLYNQILGEQTSGSFVIDKIQDDKDLIDNIKKCYKQISSLINKTEFADIFENINEFDTNKIIITNITNVTKLSHILYEDWSHINLLRKEDYKISHPKIKDDEKIEKEIEKIPLSLFEVKKLIQNDKFIEQKPNFDQKFIDLFANLIKNIKDQYANCKEILDTKYEQNNKDLIKNDDKIQKIKALLDSIKKLQEFVKIFIPKDDSIDTDNNFYNAIDYKTLSSVIAVYNKARNYLTQKPYSTEKFPLTFECPTLLNGWDVNKETSNHAILLEKNGLYYLGIMDKEHNKIFESKFDKNTSNCYKKFDYKLLPGPNKMLPKVFIQAKEVKKTLPEKFIDNYKQGKHKKGDKFDLNFCHELIDFYKDRINKHKDWKNFDFKFKNTKEYSDINEFYKQVKDQGYKITTRNIPTAKIDEFVKNGKLFLFQIYNKDFSKFSKGTPNLHTMYWRALFDEQNLKDVVYKLSGGAEIFYRKKSLEAHVTHPANQPIKNKNPNAIKKESIFKEDLIKDRRFTEDKFMFHVPIELNFKSKDLKSINDLVNEEIKKQRDINIIGVDRGERNLIYIVVINSKGELLEQLSLNEIVSSYGDQTYKTNYHDLLDKKEKERDEARKSWKSIENIKELKEGYMSQVIHAIVNLMLKHNALIVLENLNSGFKNSRKKVEKQVYDKFETMLINKLSYLIDKKLDKNDEGGLLKAYQLVLPPNSKFKVQSGVLFYIPAWNTSKIDPVTGFVNLFDIKKSMSIEKIKDFFAKFKRINFNKQEGFFEFEFNYSDFTDKAYGIRNHWTLCTYGERIALSKNKDGNYESKEIDLTSKFKEFFEAYSINLSNIKQAIQYQDDRKFFDTLVWLFKLIVQMRNSKPNSDIDYLISPAKDKNSVFYDSRKCSNNLPKDADANGAYNIARKGLMLVEQIKNGKAIETITNTKWLEFVQNTDKEWKK